MGNTRSSRASDKTRITGSGTWVSMNCTPTVRARWNASQRGDTGAVHVGHGGKIDENRPRPLQGVEQDLPSRG